MGWLVGVGSRIDLLVLVLILALKYENRVVEEEMRRRRHKDDHKGVEYIV